MRSHSRIKRRLRWSLPVTAVLALCLPFNCVQLGPGLGNDLMLAQVYEASRTGLRLNATMLVPVNLPASWQGLFGAGHW